MAIEISGFTSGDDVFVHWRMPAPIPKCLGFALYRRRNKVEALVENYIGFLGDGQQLPQPSSTWPIQRFRWTDHLVDPGDTVAYRVVARVGTAPDQLTDGEASPWSSDVHVSAGSKISVYFNRGIVASQWVSRLLGGGDAHAINQRLSQIMGSVGDPARDALAGYDREWLDPAGGRQDRPADVYAALRTERPRVDRRPHRARPAGACRSGQRFEAAGPTHQPGPVHRPEQERGRSAARQGRSAPAARRRRSPSATTSSSSSLRTASPNGSGPAARTGR